MKREDGWCKSLRGRGEGPFEPRQGKKYLPPYPALRDRVRGKREFRWNHGQVLFALSQMAQGVFPSLGIAPAGAFRSATAEGGSWRGDEGGAQRRMRDQDKLFPHQSHFVRQLLQGEAKDVFLIYIKKFIIKG